MIEVEGLEIYRSALSAPMEFRLGDISQMQCGVIAVWSRPLPGRPITLTRLGIAGLLAGVPILFGRLFR